MVFMKKRTIPFVIAIFLFISLIFYLPSGQSKETITDDAEKVFSSIQEAIDTTFEGDTVYIYGGEYYENIIINKSVNLEGKSIDEYDSVIIGNITITVSNVSISNLFIQDGNGVTINGIDKINNITIENNIIFNNSNYGIITKEATNINIIDNFIENNYGGVFFQNVSHSTITENFFHNNEKYGIYINGSKSINNEIYRNSITDSAINAYDEGINFWNTSNEGNYWSDYEGVDENPQDDIGDTPYNITGGDNQDKYPAMLSFDNLKPLQGFVVDEDLVLQMLIVGIILAIIFCIPIGLWWRKKYFK